MKNKAAVLGMLLLANGCAGGPTRDYYNPMVVGAKFKGPITMAMVDGIEAEKKNLLIRGYSVIGTTLYSGKHPEAVELRAQAKRVGANHVIYSSRLLPDTPGSWQFSMNRFGAWGGSGMGRSDVHIVFLGNPERNAK